jgi:hypothetical protein
MEKKGEILLYQSEDGTTKIDVRLENETVWLTQKSMAELFQTTIPNINMHLKNIFEEGELVPNRTIKEFLIVRLEGNREYHHVHDRLDKKTQRHLNHQRKPNFGTCRQNFASIGC